jgi:hypothetical protein
MDTGFVACYPAITGTFTSTITVDGDDTTSHSLGIGAYIGIAFGAVGAVCVVIAGVWFYRQRRNHEYSTI